MTYRPYPDAGRALRQLERHVPGSLRDPHAYEPQILPLVDWLAEQEVQPNGGASMRDAVNRVDRRTARLTPEGEE